MVISLMSFDSVAYEVQNILWEQLGFEYMKNKKMKNKQTF